MHFKRLFRTHSIAIALALFAAAIAAFPQIHFRIAHSDINQGIELLPDSPWTPRAREFYDGNGFGSIYYKDGKGDPYLFQPFGSAVVGYTGRLFGLDINDTFLVTRIVFTAAVFLLIYAFVLLLSRSRLISLVAASVILPAQPILSMTVFFRLFRGVLPGDYWEMADPVNPGMIYLPFFGFLLLFWQFLRTRDPRWGIASALVLGLNFYNYFYTWTYLYAFGAVLWLIYLFRKEWPEVKRITAVFAGGVLVALPYLYNLFILAPRHPNYEEVSARFAVISSYEPVFVGIWVSIGILVMLFLFPKAKRDEWLFGLALVLAPIITLNQQIITGRVLQEGHYHWYFHRPTAIIVTLIAVFWLLYRRGWKTPAKLLAAAAISVSFLAGFTAQWNGYFNGPPDENERTTVQLQKYGPALAWLNVHAEKEAVVLGNNESSHLTVVYTPLNVFYHRAALHMLSASEERLRDQLFTYYRLRDVDAGEAPGIFEKERAEISTRLYGLYYRDLYKSTYDIPDEVFGTILAAYMESLAIPKSRWLEDMLAKYEVDYAIWDKEVDPAWNLSAYPFFEKAAENGPVTVYRVKR